MTQNNVPAVAVFFRDGEVRTAPVVAWGDVIAGGQPFVAWGVQLVRTYDLRNEGWHLIHIEYGAWVCPDVVSHAVAVTTCTAYTLKSSEQAAQGWGIPLSDPVRVLRACWNERPRKEFMPRVDHSVKGMSPMDTIRTSVKEAS